MHVALPATQTIFLYQTCQSLTDLGPLQLLPLPSSFYSFKWLMFLCHLCHNFNFTSSKRASVITLYKIAFHLHQSLLFFLQYLTTVDIFLFNHIFFLFITCLFHQTIAHETKDFITLLLITKRVTVTWKIPNNCLRIIHLLILKPLLNSISIYFNLHFKPIFMIRNSILKVQLFIIDNKMVVSRQFREREMKSFFSL